jgi:hypothetical protein
LSRDEIVQRTGIGELIFIPPDGDRVGLIGRQVEFHLSGRIGYGESLL